MSVRQKTTPNVKRSQERKERNKKARDLADQAQAATDGISVHELKQRGFREAQRIIAEQKKNPPVLIPAPRGSPGTRTWQQLLGSSG